MDKSNIAPVPAGARPGQVPPARDGAARERGSEPAVERRHGDRRDGHDAQIDTDFARGEDRRDEA